MTLSGTVLESDVERATVGALTSDEICSMKFELSPEQVREVFVVCELFHQGTMVSTCLVAFVPNKHLKLTDPGITINIDDINDLMVCEVQSTSLARFVELSLEGGEVIFSDNYFDLVPGHTVGVSFPRPEGWSTTEVVRSIKVRSLYDSYTE
jgi:beta-mannosidase